MKGAAPASPSPRKAEGRAESAKPTGVGSEGPAPGRERADGPPPGSPVSRVRPPRKGEGNGVTASPQAGGGGGGLDRFASAQRVFALLTEAAAARRTITYADLAFELGLSSPRRTGWFLTPLLDWCRANQLPWLAIIVVRRADGLPSGGYDPERVAAETARVFDHDWSRVAPPTPADLAAFALPELPPSLRRTASPSGAHPC